MLRSSQLMFTESISLEFSSLLLRYLQSRPFEFSLELIGLGLQSVGLNSPRSSTSSILKFRSSNSSSSKSRFSKPWSSKSKFVKSYSF